MSYGVLMALRADEVTEAVPGLYRYALSLSRDHDVAEDLVDDPRALGGVLELLGGLGGLAARVSGPVRRPGRGPSPDPFASDDDDDPPVQRIPVS